MTRTHRTATSRRPKRAPAVRIRPPHQPDVPVSPARHPTAGAQLPLARPAGAHAAAVSGVEMLPAHAATGGAALDVIGASHLTLHDTLAAWQRQQDHALNRTWRRPGGLRRQAGL